MAGEGSRIFRFRGEGGSRVFRNRGSIRELRNRGGSRILTYLGI